MAIQVVRALVLVFALSLALTGTGCRQAGAEYLGKWQNTKNKNDQFEIVRNGENFLVTKTRHSGPGTTITFVLKDGVLQSTGGFATVTFTYIKSTDRLTIPGIFGGNFEYERVK